LRENIAGFDRWRLLYRVLSDVSHRDLSTTVLGHPVSFPILVAPTAMQKMAHPDGEVATARAAAEVGTVMCASTLSNCSMEEIAEASTGPKWFQLYVYRDRGVTKELVDRAVAAGYHGLVLTVDTPLAGRRWRDIKNGFQMPAGLLFGNLEGHGKKEEMPAGKGSGIGNYLAQNLDPSLGWKDLDWLCQQSGLPVLVKGVVHPEDASTAVEHGAAAVIVSNHGGRNLDSAPATIRALPDVVKAVNGRAEVLMDGGVRWGTDIIKALALGARAVMVGRPIVWGLSVAGESGVRQVLQGLRGDLDESLAMMGCPSVRKLGPADLQPA
jgi:4-hydroxymandelate oxidase